MRGVTYKKEDSSSEPGPGLVPLLRATNIDGELDFTGLVYVPASCVGADQYLVPGDSVIAASSGSLSVVGKSATLRHEWDGTFGAFCYALRPTPGRIAPLYLSYFLQTSEYRSQVSRLAAGVNINNLKRQHLEELDIPLVSMAEQHRLVSAIESYFTRLDDAVATLERVQRNLKRYRASVLKTAVEGRLVPTEAELARAEGRGYEPASVLLTRILGERRRRWEEAELAKMKAKGKVPKDDKWKAKYVEPVTPDTSELPKLPEGWCWASVHQLVLFLDQGWSPRCERTPVTSPAEWGVIKTSAVQHMAYVEQANKALPSGVKPRPHLEVMRDDVLVTRAGPRVRVGVCCLVRNTSQRLMVCDKVYRMRTNPLNVAPAYVEVALNSSRVLDVIERIKSGISDSGLNLTQDKFAALAIPLPPRQEQTRICDAVALSLSVTDVVAEEAERTCSRAARLRQSILKWAFEGRLVDQDPTDEPASVLLERIRAARASATDTPPRGTRRANGRAPKS
jgi:type I restriction enzyme S subunit